MGVHKELGSESQGGQGQERPLEGQGFIFKSLGKPSVHLSWAVTCLLDPLHL